MPVPEPIRDALRDRRVIVALAAIAFVALGGWALRAASIEDGRALAYAEMAYNRTAFARATSEAAPTVPPPTPTVSPDHRVAIAWLPETVTRWTPLLEEASERHGPAADLLAIKILIESGGNPHAVSSAGACGLSQVMPGTAADIARIRGLKAPSCADFHADPALNIDFGAWYLARQLATFGDASEGPPWQRSVELAAVAYNGGPGSAWALLRGAAVPSEALRYQRWMGGMWQERHDDASPTLERWLAAGGRRLVSAAEGVSN